MTDRIRALEDALAHQIAETDALSDTVRDQAMRLDRLERLVHALQKRAAEAEAEAGAALFASRPPHY